MVDDLSSGVFWVVPISSYFGIEDMYNILLPVQDETIVNTLAPDSCEHCPPPRGPAI